MTTCGPSNGATPITTTLYHYTDMGGLQGILTNEEIWFTDYRHLNDPNELMHGIGIAKSLLQQRSKQHGLRPFLFQCIDDLLTKKNFWRVFEFFIASFSRNPDDLGQWRAYADDGRALQLVLRLIFF
jgi:hypothetical protein